jgi:MinD-like ATPase involved in chromosome partitioning or flagellar assembly
MNIAIASGKGGTGKTFVSTNLFWALQESGKEITLVDCDAEEPNVAEFISGREKNRQLLYKFPRIKIEQISTLTFKYKIEIVETFYFIHFALYRFPLICCPRLFNLTKTY